MGRSLPGNTPQTDDARQSMQAPSFKFPSYPSGSLSPPRSLLSCLLRPTTGRAVWRVPAPVVHLAVAGRCQRVARLCGSGFLAGGPLCPGVSPSHAGRPLRLRTQPHATEHHLQPLSVSIYIYAPKGGLSVINQHQSRYVRFYPCKALVRSTCIIEGERR